MSVTGNKSTCDLKHFLSLDNENIFICHECGEHFSDENALHSHCQLHVEHKPYLCGVCKEIFAHKNELDSHFLLHEVTGKPFNCDACGSRFDDSSDYCKHLLTHSTIKQLKDNTTQFICQLCDKIFVRLSNLERHMFKHSTKSFVCDMCKKRFSFGHEIRNHICLHVPKKPFYCDVCNKGYQKKFYLFNHMRSNEHKLATAKNINLKIESVVSLSAKAYSCKKCFRSFSQKHVYDIHLLCHTSKAINCDTCGKEFNDRRGYSKHRAMHSTVKSCSKSIKNFTCKLCRKEFVSDANLRRHFAQHNTKTIMCVTCKKQFSFDFELREHACIQCPERPYQCVICNKYYKRKWLLFNHIRSDEHKKMALFKECSPKIENVISLQIVN